VKVCAAERAAESLAQPEEARRDASGPSDLPENESWRGKEHIVRLLRYVISARQTMNSEFIEGDEWGA